MLERSLGQRRRDAEADPREKIARDEEPVGRKRRHGFRRKQQQDEGEAVKLDAVLNVGLSYESWTGADPKITKITPSVQYVFYQVQAVKPYVGAFYRRTSIDGLPDLDSIGGRAGAYFQLGRNAYLGLGGVYESYLDCNSGTYRKCSSTYGEASLTFAF